MPARKPPPTHRDLDLRSAIASIRCARSHMNDPEGVDIGDLESAIRCLADAIESLVAVVGGRAR